MEPTLNTPTQHTNDMCCDVPDDGSTLNRIVLFSGTWGGVK